MRLFVYLPAVRLLSLTLVFLCAFSVTGHGQGVVYVNTDNLIMRDRPEKQYFVVAIVHAPCRLDIEPWDVGYDNDKTVIANFLKVSFSYESNGIHHLIAGWVARKYLVPDLAKVTVHGLNTRSQTIDPVPLITYSGDFEHNPNRENARDFLPPKYKGGEKQPGIARRVYHKGPRGGCYYINGKGHKVYVDKKRCDKAATR